MKIKKPLFGKPVGSSELGGKLGKYWSPVMRIGTERSVICEICGTIHLAGNIYTPRSFLGLQMIEECCGALIDRIYSELCEEFAIAFLTDFSEEPTADKYKIFIFVLKQALQDAKKKLAKTTEAVSEISEAAEALQK